MKVDSLGDRMKKYEMSTRIFLTPRTPVILRLDGVAFHTYTRKCQRPFDDRLIEALNQVGLELCKKIQGTQLCYLQSDELTLLLHSYKKFDTQAWFDNQVQKITSVAAGIASAIITQESIKIFGKVKPGYFDCRAFTLPEAEVCNNFIFRQNDCTRNSIQMVAQSLYSHKELHKKNSSILQEMIFQKGINWNDFPTHYKRGRCIKKVLNSENKYTWVIDSKIPIFSKDRFYIEDFLIKEEE